MYYIYPLVVLILILGTMITMLCIQQSQISNTRKKQVSINLKADKSIKNSNFQITKKFYLNDNATYNKSKDCKKYIAIDNDNKQICLIDYEKANMLIVGFNEILNYEVYENGSNLTAGGSIGGFWSGIFGAETNGMCKDLKLIIRLRRYDISQVAYEIISNTSLNIGISKSSDLYKQCISTLQEVISFLEVVKSEEKT